MYLLAIPPKTTCIMHPRLLLHPLSHVFIHHYWLVLPRLSIDNGSNAANASMYILGDVVSNGLQRCGSDRG